jgi:Na+/melibiose symporter-like transporter
MQNGNSAHTAVPPPQGAMPASAASTTLTSYYSDRKLMWRNVLWITFGHFGSSLSQTILEPLMNLRLKSIGVSESVVGLIVSINLWAVSFLVMYVSWKSDHCTSRLGRRTPFTLLSLPFILLALVLFPLSTHKWLLIGLMLIYFFFNDVKASSYPLLGIDCVSKDVLARVSGLVAITISAAGFLSTRLGAKMADTHPARVFFIGAIVMTSMTLLALWQIKEPPIYHPAQSKFNLLAPIKVACRDKRIMVLILAIALLNAFPMIFKTWVWFYSVSKLGLTIGDTGTAMSWGLVLQFLFSYPAGWLIDRLGSYLALSIGWFLLLALTISSAYVTNLHGLLLLMSLYFLFVPFQVAGDTLLWKTMDVADTGSYTSTAALMRNFCTGTVVAISGFLIKWTGSYIVAFWFGFTFSSIAVIVFFIFRHIMRSGPTLQATVAEEKEETGGIAIQEPLKIL